MTSRSREGPPAGRLPVDLPVSAKDGQRVSVDCQVLGIERPATELERNPESIEAGNSV